MDPSQMEMAQQLMNDPEIMSLLQDPSVSSKSSSCRFFRHSHNFPGF